MALSGWRKGCGKPVLGVEEGCCKPMLAVEEGYGKPVLGVCVDRWDEIGLCLHVGGGGWGIGGVGCCGFVVLEGRRTSFSVHRDRLAVGRHRNDGDVDVHRPVTREVMSGPDSSVNQLTESQLSESSQ